MRAVLAGKPLLVDPLVIRKKWQEDEYEIVDHGGGKQLCFGMLWNNGEVVPHPPVTRGLEIAKQALIDAGHKSQVVFMLLFCFAHPNPPLAVIDWKPLKHTELCSTAVNLFRYVIMITQIDSFFVVN